MKPFISAGLIGIAQLSKILLGLFLIKMIALYLGPEGLGKLGHFMSLLAFLTIISGGGIQSGIVKYVSEYKMQPIKLIKFIEESTSYSLYFSIIFFVLFTVFSKDIANFLFKDADLYFTIIILAIVQFFMAFNKIVIGVANGFRETKIFSISQVIGTLSSIPVIWFLMDSYGFLGGIFSFTISFLLTSIPLFYFYKKSIFWLLAKVKIKFSKQSSKLHRFALMALVSAIVFPMVEIIIRQMIINHSGYEDAGIWQASIRLSSVYVGFFGLFLSYYFLPTISPEKNIKNIKKLIYFYSFTLGAIFLIGASILYFGRDYIIPLLLSEKFLILTDFIHLQLIGDFFKMLAFVIGFVFVAKALVWFYIFVEILQGIILLGITTLLYDVNSTITSIFEAYMISNFIFFIFMLVSINRYLKIKSLKGFN